MCVISLILFTSTSQLIGWEEGAFYTIRLGKRLGLFSNSWGLIGALSLLGNRVDYQVCKKSRTSLVPKDLGDFWYFA